MTHVHITEKSGIPLMGSLYFGVIDRGTSLLQVRPSCGCNLNCPFCSVDAGPASRTRATSYEVDMEYLLGAVQEIARFKGPGVECHIDSPGEPLMYRRLPDLVAALRKIPEVTAISLQTNGTLLNADTIAALESAGLDRVNLSLHALDPGIAKMLAGVDWFEIDTLTESARAVARSRIDLLIAPVYVPGINDDEIPKLIRFAREIGAGKRFPPLGIQKFEHYRYGRTPKGVKSQSWWQFYNRSLAGWEKESGLRLRLDPSRDFQTIRRPFVPLVFDKGEKVTVEIRAPGWIRGEMLGVARDRVVSVYNCGKQAGNVRVKIVSTKHNIYTAQPV
ncbi:MULTISPECIES: radical SAM protein [unclassified Methanoregula]|uniref:radical SAM protein n=1 Tax=unclassified Methanoregula TaxID=2649730 RepID=UPI0009CBF65F|nr:MULTISPECIES: radical SAM protein [unclassified Methanoregula]OPX64083.1 MAG: molybdenum cofactor biosynthesis protein A [Methanoregula sp. PtaB.Bin085]OPY34797.1 MAG: molybdenum cofactor biosynthesis protein A [Methanoregula sp. PtaU1.Bin006]